MDEGCKKVKELEIDIIQECVLENQVDVGRFMSKFNIKLANFTNSLMAVNHLLKTDLKSKDGRVYVSEKNRQRCYRYLKFNKIKMLAYYDSFVRRDLLYFHFLFDHSDLSLQEIADVLLVSKNTALSDIKKLKEEIEPQGIYIKYSRKTGYAIFGSEFSIRNELCMVLQKILEFPYGRYLLLDTGYIFQNEILLLQNRLINVQEKAKVTFTEESIENLPFILMFLIKRGQDFRQSWHFPFEKYDLRNTKEYPIYEKIFSGFDDLNEHDKLYMVVQILSMRFIKNSHQLYKSSEINKATDQFIQFLEDECVMQFKDDKDLKNKLLLHLKPAIFRCLLRVNIKNPLAERVSEEYKILMEKISEGLRIIEKAAGVKFPNEEVAFIAMIVISSMIGIDEEKGEVKTFTAIVLCRSGMSISKLLLENLRQLFPNIEFIGTYAIRDVTQSEITPDFLFTTIPVNTDITTFLIPSYLDKEAKDKLSTEVEVAINQDVKKKTKELYSLLDDLFPESSKKDALKRIESFYKKDSLDLGVEDGHFQIEKAKFSIIDAQNWEKVFDFSFKKIFDRGSITQDYANKAKKIFSEDYYYMKIAKESFLPHAKPSDGVIHPDYQFVLLRNEVSMPDKTKMKIMVALVPSENNKHVEWLLEMNNILLNKNAQIELNKVTTEDELFTLMKQYFQKSQLGEVEPC